MRTAMAHDIADVITIESPSVEPGNARPSRLQPIGPRLNGPGVGTRRPTREPPRMTTLLRLTDA